MNGVWTTNFENLKKGWVLGYFKQEVNPVYATDGIVEGALYSSGTTGGGNGFGIACLYPFFSVDSTVPSESDQAINDSSGLFSATATSNNTPTWVTDHIRKTTTMTRQRTSSSSVTLNSWGLYAEVYLTSGSTRRILCYRELFDEPITVAQYETIRLTFTLEGYLDGTVTAGMG